MPGLDGWGGGGGVGLVVLPIVDYTGSAQKGIFLKAEGIQRGRDFTS